MAAGDTRRLVFSRGGKRSLGRSDGRGRPAGVNGDAAGPSSQAAKGRKLASVLRDVAWSVSIKATTTERLGFTGAKRGPCRAGRGDHPPAHGRGMIEAPALLERAAALIPAYAAQGWTIATAESLHRRTDCGVLRPHLDDDFPLIRTADDAGVPLRTAALACVLPPGWRGGPCAPRLLQRRRAPLSDRTRSVVEGLGLKRPRASAAASARCRPALRGSRLRPAAGNRPSSSRRGNGVKLSSDIPTANIATCNNTRRLRPVSMGATHSSCALIGIPRRPRRCQIPTAIIRKRLGSSRARIERL